MKKILYFLAAMIILILGCGKSAQEYYDQGHAKILDGDNKGAIVDFNKAIEIDKKYVDAYINRGIAKNGIEDYKGAEDDYTIALKNDTNSYIAYFNSCLLYTSPSPRDGL